MSFLLQVGGRFVLASALGVVLPLIIALILNRASDSKVHVPSSYLSIALVAISVVGATAGISGGMSRSAAVGDIIPAFLGVLGGVAIYIFGVKEQRGVLASLCSATLAIALLSGFVLAAQYRHNTSSDRSELRTICAEAYTNADLLGNDKAFDRFRESLVSEDCDTVLHWTLD